MNILIVDDEVSALRDLARTIEKTVQDADIKKSGQGLGRTLAVPGAGI